MSTKLLYLDLETTGLFHYKCGIIQIAGYVEIDGVEVDKFDFKVKPFPQDEIQEQALAVNNTTKAELATYPDPEQVFGEFEYILSKHVDKFSKTDKFHIVGYNSLKFDEEFLRQFFKKNGSKYYGSWFWNPGLDVMVLAGMALCHRRHEMENFKLGTVAATLGLSVAGPAHQAMNDIELTRLIFKKITSE